MTLNNFAERNVVQKGGVYRLIDFQDVGCTNAISSLNKLKLGVQNCMHSDKNSCYGSYVCIPISIYFSLA